MTSVHIRVTWLQLNWRGNFNMSKHVDPLLLTMHDLGKMQAEGRAVLPKLALSVAIAADNGDVGPEDAATLYIEYQRGATGVTLDVTQQATRVQVSKLRQVIKVAQDHDAVGLLERCTQVWHDARQRTRPLYALMVDAARLQLAQRKPLPDKRIAELLKR